MLLLNNPDAPDALSRLLLQTQVGSTVYCHADLAAPWGFSIPARQTSTFHIVVSGAPWFREEDGEPVLMNPGDVVLLLGGNAHAMMDDPSTPAEPLDDLVRSTPPDARARLRQSGNGPRTRLICGGFELEGAGVRAIRGALPPTLMHVSPAASTFRSSIMGTLEMVENELEAWRPGSEGLVNKLMDALVARAVCETLNKAAADGSRVRWPADPQIAAALRLIHAEPERPWTVDDLASQVALSRSALAMRFKNAVGEPVMRYVTGVRLALARHYLQDGARSIRDVARRVGYGSEAALSRAMVRELKATPGEVRAGRRVADR